VSDTNIARRDVRTVLCALAFVFVAVFPAAAQRQQLQGHIPQVITKLNLRPLGQFPTTNHLYLAIGLPLRDQEAAKTFIQQLYDPASPVYHQYLTPEQFAEKFGATKQDYEAVVAFAMANGLAVRIRHPNRLLLDVEGASADIERAFQVKILEYQHPTEARTFYAPDVEPSVPSSLKILDISGLSSYARPHPMIHVDPASNPKPNAGSGPGNTYRGNDFRVAYVPGTSLTGIGQSVALVQFDGYYPIDITNYETQAGLPAVTLTNILLDAWPGNPFIANAVIEVSLDIEMSISMAPGLSKVMLYEGNPTNFIPNDVLSRIANDNAARQISCSWGWTGGPSASTDNIFIQMTTQGQTFFVASGDSDAYPGSSVDDVCTNCFGTPAASAYVTSVGGTTLSTSGPTNNWVSETTWNRGNGVGSSGGFSSFYAIPIWQQGVSMTNNQGSTTGRNFPDVALTAENVYVRANNGTDYDGVGGTSCASPLWAGFMALVNQQGALNNLPSVGFVNPAIYTIGTGTSYAVCFHDVTTGNNEWSNSTNAYSAVAGYDLCTGWGSPNGTNLINALVGPPLSIPIITNAGSALLLESCSPTNGFIDPGETVTINFALQNVGSGDASNVVATLLATNGVTVPSNPQSYGTILGNGGTISESFSFTANGTCGGNIAATLQLQTNATNLGTVIFTFALGSFAPSFTQNFDSTIAPALPAGWTTSAGGGESLWVTSTAANNTPPNAAFSPDPGSVGSNALISPVIPILSSKAQLTFRNNYSLEAGSGATGYDGGVLEIKIGSGAFQDILTAGGTFIANGYNHTISSSFSNPLKGRQAWSGSSGGFVATVVNLPATAAGQNIQLRWRCGTDSSVSKAGWYIDTISISDLSCCTGVVNHAPVISAASISPGSPTTTNDLVANVTSASDADGDPITFAYQWEQSIDNTNFNNIAFTNSTLPAVATVAGDYYAVMITPNDGKTNGAPFTTASVSVAVDADGNGINDDWEVQYFGKIGVDPHADPDGDGCNNLCEFLSGTDPTNVASSFRITAVTVQGSNNTDILVSWQTGGGRTNVVQATGGAPDGSYATNFLDVSPLIVISGTGDQTTNYLDAGGATNAPSRFYRVRLVP